MKRTMELSIAILFGCLFVGYVLKAEAAAAKSPAATAQVQADGCDSDGSDYWSLFSAAAAAQ